MPFDFDEVIDRRNTGSLFGEYAGQFQRVVLACPRSVVMKAMEQLKAAIAE